MLLDLQSFRPVAGRMRDSSGREIHYLRISLTDRCNLRCIYCMPERGVNFQPHEHLLTDEELLCVVRLAARLGFDRLRLTGGEPTMRPNLVALVEGISRISGIKEIALTTNGIQLAGLAEPLANAGLKRVNISIDTLDAERFAQLTRVGKLEAVWRGIRAAEHAGLDPIKLNAVIVRGYNEGDIVDLARLTLDHPWEMRFIEVMPVGSIADFQTDSLVPADEIRRRIETAFGSLEPLEWNKHTPARSYRLRGGRGKLGFISSVSEPFCEGCNRVRLTADGKLRLCLLRDDELDLRTPLRAGAGEDQLLELIRTGIYNKPWGHGLGENVHPHERFISEIGG
jgi:cyclic pyranopterin phosphate synthase